MPRDLSVRAGNRKTTKSDLGVIDLPYFFLTLLLVAVGLIVLLSASYARAYHVTGNSASYFTSQLVFALMGVAAMLFVSRVPYDWYRKFYRVIFAVTVLLLVGLIYIIETLSDIIQVTYFKLSHGKRVFKMAPIHHHFEMCGWSEKKIWVVFVLTTVVMCVVAWFGVKGWF